MKKSEYIVVGLMSGTSLDGLDLVLLRFQKKSTWKFQILKSKTINYSNLWRKKLLNAYRFENQKNIDRIDREFGSYLGIEIKNFIANTELDIDFVASHGHTIFHRPSEGITKQIGNATEISKKCGLDVINNFRILDVSLGGQGAPLVPIGDKYLFGNYEACINLGGFANISYEKNGERIAYDICPVNIVLNDLAMKLGQKYDNGGEIASKAKAHKGLLKELNALAYYLQFSPKSLGREWVEKTIIPILDAYNISIEDKICTFTEHAAKMISEAIISFNEEILLTGGGTYNNYLISKITENTKSCTLSIPTPNIIDFKEALIFAFMGVLRVRGEVNVLRTVTGASRDSCSGEIVLFRELAKVST